MNKVRVRAALSPTGSPHLGTVRTALFNYLFAKANKGAFFIRIDDTDKARTVEGAEEEILSTLKNFGINWDEDPLIQSERLDRYKNAVEELVKNKKAYHCFCTEERLKKIKELNQSRGESYKYDRKCLELSVEESTKRIEEGDTSVIRLKVPENESIPYKDHIRGTITVLAKDIDDQILLKSDGYPTYHLANVVDDHDLNISHVIRADEWLASTPKHALLFEAFEWEAPIFVHVPLIVNENKKKLSKRDGDFGINHFLNEGYVQSALLNYIALLGWRPKEAELKEFFSLAEMEKLFTLEALQKSPAVFDVKKLDWFNAHYIKEAGIEELYNAVNFFLTEEIDEKVLIRFLEVERDRMITLKDIQVLIEPFSEKGVSYKTKLLKWKEMETKNIKESLEWSFKVVTKIKEDDWGLELLEKELRLAIANEDKVIGEVLWPLRVALSGVEKGPSPFACLYILGKEKSAERIQSALEKL